jgi:hypothetical protein
MGLKIISDIKISPVQRYRELATAKTSQKYLKFPGEFLISGFPNKKQFAQRREGRQASEKKVKTSF